IENTPSFKNFAYVELNEGWLFQDSYIQQHVLSRGAALLFQTSGPVEKNSVPLSPFHGVHISKLGAKDCLSEEQDAKLESFFRQVSEYVQKESEEGLWPAWHEKRCHATVRMKCNG
ncbi:MAG: hypothetical protein ACXVA9_05680, partial [Bdellovibrionales bacterium]